MAECAIGGTDVYELGEGDFYSTFNYMKLKVLAKGMCGEIALVESSESSETTEQKRVVKTFTLLDREKRDRNQRMFNTEVMLMQSFDHPYLMKCILAAQSSKFLGLTMPYYQKGTLERHVGSLSVTRSELCVTQVACALRYMHTKNIVHLDVKLDNIFMDEDMNAILGDFGLAMDVLPQQQALFKCQCGGTPIYYAPERRGAPGDKWLDPYKLDSYSLGVVMWALVFKKFPNMRIRYHLAAKHTPDLPISTREWLLNLLEMDPLKRMTVTDILTTMRQKSAFPTVIARY